MDDRRTIVILIFILIALLLVACTPGREARRDYVRSHDRPARIEQAIVDAEIVPGMTKADVRASWGDPGYSGNEGAQWCYMSYGRRLDYEGDRYRMTYSSQCIYFQNDRVTGWN